jgi:hypothetical protein
MITIPFEGWFQCRLSTDPDPFDEPRGVSGSTIAVAGEPDLDRIVRFQPEGATVRSHTPPIGVRVKQDGHPLANARVNLLGEPKFEGRNGLVSEDAREPILPFEIEISAGLVRIARADPLTPTPLRIYEVPPKAFARQQGKREPPPAAPEALATAGVPDPTAAIRQRVTALRADLAAAPPGSAERVAIGDRLTFLVGIVPFVIPYGFDVGALGGEGTVHDPGGVLGGQVDVHAPWPLRFWLGIWDADALSGYVKGRLELPLVTT